MKTASAYLAGVFDGEGSILVAKGNRGYHRCVQVVNTFRPVLVRFQQHFGGNIYKTINPTSLGTKQVYTWKICAKPDLLRFLAAVLPFVFIKCRRASLLWRYLQGEFSHKEMRRRMGIRR